MRRTLLRSGLLGLALLAAAQAQPASPRVQVSGGTLVGRAEPGLFGYASSCLWRVSQTTMQRVRHW